MFISSIRAIQQEAKGNLTPGAMSPMNAIIEYQAFASSIAKNMHTPPNTHVSEDGMRITYGITTLEIPKFRTGLRRLADEVTRELKELCLDRDFGLDLTKDTFDDWDNNDRGYGWTTNGDFLDDKRGLLAALLEDPEFANITEDGNLRFNHTKVWDFIHRCDKINKKLSLLAFFTSGQTPRITEFVEYKYANSTRP